MGAAAASMCLVMPLLILLQLLPRGLPRPRLLVEPEWR